MFQHIMKIAMAVAFGFVLNSGVYSQPSGWEFQSIYSNADGSVQFVVLSGYPDSTLAGQTLIASDGKSEHSFTFPSNVVNSSGSCDVDIGGLSCVSVVYVLVATQGFADLNVVRPDSVVPNGFLFLPSGSVRLGVSEYRYDAPPANGAAEAENNASEYYSFKPNFTGFWWAAPAGSESGWGINFAHQGNTIFATWLTYDANGRPWWLTMIANRTFAVDRAYEDLIYNGTVYRAHLGAPFGAFVTPPVLTAVGTATLSFSGDSAGEFAYTVNDGMNIAMQTKAITRLTFGPAPTCVWGLQPDLTKATNYQDLWWAAPAGSESGWGVNLAQQGMTIFATWLTYDANRDPLWMSVTAKQTAPGTFSGELVRTTGPAFGAVAFGPVQQNPAGTATFAFADGNTGTFSYNVDLGDSANKASGIKPITRMVFHQPGTVCQ